MKPHAQHSPDHQTPLPHGATRGFVPASTGDLNDGLCYFITLIENGTLTPEEQESYKNKKQQILTLLTEAGVRGARSKIKEYASELNNLFLEEIDPLLNKRASGNNDHSRHDQWISALRNTPGCHLIDLAVRGNHTHLLLRWSGDTSLDIQISTWKNLFPHTSWDDSTYCIQVTEDEVDAFARIVAEERSIIGAASPIPPMEGEPSSPPEDISFHHLTVLLNETVDALLPAPGKIIVDTTLGGGGHAEMLLERGATVIGIDQDPDARQAAAARLQRFGDRFKILAGNFRNAASLLKREGISQVDALLADIGVSSHQIDTPERGFSFRGDGPLDMRMSPEIPLSAADIIATSDENELVRIFREYGEEKAARPMARLIVQSREKSPITTTAQLAALAEKAIPRRSGHHPGTKIFQALRIMVNDELGSLSDLLQASISLLAPGGRLAIITFHSLEDRCVKRFMELHSKQEIDRPEWPEPRPNPDYHFNLVNKRPIIASEQEIKINPRSRSAKLRVAQKIN